MILLREIMLYILLSLASGAFIGFFIRKRKKASSIFSRATSGIIFVLLFILGMTVGLNESLFKNLSTVGIKALVLTFGGLSGSVCLSLLVYRLFFRAKGT